MRRRRDRTILALMCMGVAMLPACESDSSEPTVNPTIEFRTDAGYTWMNDTVSTEDTLVVGVVIRRGSDAMDLFKVTVKYDNGPEVTTDSLPMGTDDFEFDKTIITRDTTGTERWYFNVVENDGDVIRRGLTFTVVQ
jgi:hypothetical protein